MAKKPPDQPKQPRMVLLVHGIRDPGFWQQKLRSLFEAEGVVAKPIGFHVFDVFRFLFGFRRKAIERVRQQIEAAIASNPSAEITVIAHSFGTYTVSRILDEDPNLKISRLVMCGAIVPRNYRWDKVSRLNAQGERLKIVNEFSARDIWPLFARQATFGFGDVGTIGCQDADVTDRRHDIRHSEYLTEAFASKYWVPWLAKGTPLVDPQAPDANPWYFALNRSPLTLAAAVLAAIALFSGYVSYDRNNFRTQGTIEYGSRAGVNFQITGFKRKDGQTQETVFSAQNPTLKTRHALFSDARFQKIEVVIKNRIPIQCNESALEDAAPPERNELNQTIYEFDLSRAYHMFGKAHMQFFYESAVRENDKAFDRLTLFAGDGIDDKAVHVLKVTHTGDECLDESYQNEDFSPFVRIKPAKDVPKGLFTSLVSDAFAQMYSKKPDNQEIKDLLASPDQKLQSLAIDTIIANPKDYEAQVKSMVLQGDGNNDSLAALILAARNAAAAPIQLDTNRMIELSYTGNPKVRDAARSYLRNASVVSDEVAAAAQSKVDRDLASLAQQPVPGSAYARDYLLLVAVRDIYYNLGFKRLEDYLAALRSGRTADLKPVLSMFEKGRALRERAANADQKIALAKNTYGLAYALYVSAMNQEAVAEGKGETPDEFVDRLSKQGRKLKDQKAAKVFGTFLGEVSSNAKLYPWPTHITQAQNCSAKLLFGCLTAGQAPAN